MEHFDVLIVGAGLSGIGAAYHLQTRCPEEDVRHPRRRARPSAGHGTSSAIPASARTRTCTRSATPSGRGPRPRPSPTGPRSCSYVRETAGGLRHRPANPLRHRLRARGLVTARARWTVEASAGRTRETVRCHLRLPLHVRAATTTTPAGYTPDSPGASGFAGRDRASAAVAGGPGLRGQTGGGDRLRRDGGDAGAGDGQGGRARDMVQRSPTYIVSRPAQDASPTGCARGCRRGRLRHHALAATSLLRHVLLSLAAQEPAGGQEDSSSTWCASSCGPDYDVADALHAALQPVGPAALPGAGRRLVRGDARTGTVSVVTDASRPSPGRDPRALRRGAARRHRSSPRPG